MVDNTFSKGNIVYNPNANANVNININEQQSGPIKVKQIQYSLYSWGFSKYGQTGIDNCQYIISPNAVQYDNAKEIIEVSSGESNNAFITKNGSLFIYGKNTFGQLGNDTTKISPIPLLIPLTSKCIKVSLGGEHIIALTQDNILYSWGLNVFGQLGLGHTENISTPTQVERLGFFTEQNNESLLKEVNRSISDERVIEIAAGPQHSMILTNQNMLYSCGFSKSGALGYYCNDLDPTESMIFTRVINEITSRLYSNIACGLNHSGCIVGKRDLLIWGKSDCLEFEGIKRFKLAQQLSNKSKKDNCNNNQSESNSVMNLMISNTTTTNNNNNDSKDTCLLDFKIGEDFFLVQLANGEVYSSGTNTKGQLGIGSNFNSNPLQSQQQGKLFEKVTLPEKVKKISVGYSFAYAIGVSGKVYGWGSNKYGQLLDIESEVIALPKEIPDLTDLSPQLISCGGYHTQFLCTTSNKANQDPSLSHNILNFKHIPLNKAFDPNQYKKDSLFLDSISEFLQKEIQLQSEINDKEKSIQQLTKVINEKTQLRSTDKASSNAVTSSIISSSLSNKAEGVEGGNVQSPSQTQIQNNYLQFEKLFEEEIQMKDLTFPQNDFLGSGAFGDVRKAYWRKYLVAVKSLKKDMESQENQVKPFIEKYNLLKKLRHPNILLYLGGCITGPEHFLVTEYCENGNLFEFLHGIGSPKINNKDRLRLALQIAKGVNYLHSFNPPIMHRDLKSLNILLDKNYDVKIADFGWARLKTEHMTKKRGTFQWMAPEVIIKDSYTEKADVYSFGIILWEFWSNDPPYKDLKAATVAQKVKTDKNYRPKIPSDVPMEIAALIQKCWDFEPTKRPTYLEIINIIEAFLKKI